MKPEATRDWFWVGFDGMQLSDHTVEQIGTIAWCADTTPLYTTFYEMYPRPPTIGFKVHAGDRILADVKWEGARNYHLVLVDLSTGKRLDETASEHALRSSAEWVVEMSSVCRNCLEDFGRITFTDASATGNGSTGGIDAFPDRLIKMTNPVNGRVRAQPSALSKQGSVFSVSWESQ